MSHLLLNQLVRVPFVQTRKVLLKAAATTGGREGGVCVGGASGATAAAGATAAPAAAGTGVVSAQEMRGPHKSWEGYIS